MLRCGEERSLGREWGRPTPTGLSFPLDGWRHGAGPNRLVGYRSDGGGLTRGLVRRRGRLL